MSLSPAFLDELRARTLLSALVGKTLKLQKKGREFAACCPFHNEKTPSFYVNDEKGFYHCFGCGAHGDAIRWMTDQRGLPFIEALSGVAEVAVVGAPHPDFGEGVVAGVVGSASAQAIMAGLENQLAPYKRPKLVRIVDALPRNAMGKVEKAVLRREVADVFA